MASGDPLFGFGNPAAGNSPPTSNAAVPDQVGVQWGLSYGQSTDGFFPFWLPNYYASGGITLTLAWASPSGGPTSGNVVWQAAFCRFQDATTDISSLTFATAQIFTTTAVAGTVGIVKYLTKTFTDGTQLNGLLKNERGVLQVTRNTTNDTATG